MPDRNTESFTTETLRQRAQQYRELAEHYESVADDLEQNPAVFDADNAPNKSDEQETVSALYRPLEVAAVRGMTKKEAIRKLAEMNDGEFKPQQHRKVMIAAGVLKPGRNSSFELNGLLNEMTDLHHVRRNLWVFVTPRPSEREIFRDGWREEAEEYEERIQGVHPDYITHVEDLIRQRN